jgi:hypothetical protein
MSAVSPTQSSFSHMRDVKCSGQNEDTTSALKDQVSLMSRISSYIPSQEDVISLVGFGAMGGLPFMIGGVVTTLSSGYPFSTILPSVVGAAVSASLLGRVTIGNLADIPEQDGFMVLVPIVGSFISGIFIPPLLSSRVLSLPQSIGLGLTTISLIANFVMAMGMVEG